MKPSTESTQLSTLPRRYTLAEIDEMRECLFAIIRIECASPWGTFEEEVVAKGEPRLRTYLLAGVDPQELRDKLTEAKKNEKPFWRPVQSETIQTPL